MGKHFFSKVLFHPSFQNSFNAQWIPQVWWSRLEDWSENICLKLARHCIFYWLWSCLFTLYLYTPLSARQKYLILYRDTDSIATMFSFIGITTHSKSRRHVEEKENYSGNIKTGPVYFKTELFYQNFWLARNPSDYPTARLLTDCPLTHVPPFKLNVKQQPMWQKMWPGSTISPPVRALNPI